MATQPQAKRPTTGQIERPEREADDIDRIRCRECGRTYPALDGPALLHRRKADCPHCGGGFELVL